MNLNEFLLKKIKKEFPFLGNSDLQSGDQLHVILDGGEKGLCLNKTYGGEGYSCVLGTRQDGVLSVSLFAKDGEQLAHLEPEWAWSYAHNHTPDRDGNDVVPVQSISETVVKKVYYCLVKETVSRFQFGSGHYTRWTIIKTVQGKEALYEAEKAASQKLEA